MKILNIKTYQCEHCDRRMFGAGAMGWHEKYCKQNPNNRHMCFQYCRNLIKTEKIVPSSYYEDDYGYGTTKQTEFTCKKTGKKMYSYKREKQYWQYVTSDMIRMPLECKFYKSPESEDIEDNFETNIF